MSELEKLYALLSKEGRALKYGVRTDETDLVVGLTPEASLLGQGHLGDAPAAEYPTVAVTVYASDCLAAYLESNRIKAEIKAAVKRSVRIAHYRDENTVYDRESGCYQVKTLYKIIKI